ncbi:MAG: hypothetical protein HKM28_01430, partial [Flavobacteriaceae bacterium]|nr:hypothetical protein [Flavobacteriaceae bacterium]
MKFLSISLILCISYFSALPLMAQVGINTQNPAGLLDIAVSDPFNPTPTDGLLIPKLEVFPAVDPDSAQDGMLVFLNNDISGYKKGIHFWDDDLKQWVGYGGEWNDGIVTQGRGDFSNNLVYARQAGINEADVVILDSGQFGIGTDTPEESLELKFPGDNDLQISSVSPPNAPNLIFYTTGGSSFTNRDLLVDNDDIGYITGKAWSGSSKTSDVSNMKMMADGNHSSNNYPTKIQFSVTAPGDNTDSSSGMEMTIRATGDVGIGTEDPTQKLDVAGSVRIRDLGAGAVVSDTNGNLSIGPTTVAAGKVSAAGSAIKITGATVSNTGVGSYRVTFDSARAHSDYIIQLTIVRCNSCGASDDSFTVYYTNPTLTHFDVHTGSN